MLKNKRIKYHITFFNGAEACSQFVTGFFENNKELAEDSLQEIGLTQYL